MLLATVEQVTRPFAPTIESPAIQGASDVAPARKRPQLSWRVPSVAWARATTCTTDLAAMTISFCASIPWRVSASASSERAAMRSSRSVSIERARSIISGTIAISASSSSRARMLSVACGLLARGAPGRRSIVMALPADLAGNQLRPALRGARLRRQRQILVAWRGGRAT
jgi:hypothetical protein